MDLIGLAASLAIALAAGLGITVFVTAIRASRIRLKRMRAEPVELPRVPEATRGILDVGRRWLLPRGFRYVNSWRIRPMLAKATEWTYCDVYAREGSGIFAIVSPREQPSPGDTTAIEFQSVFADGTVMTTYNRYGHAVVWEPPRWKIADDCVADMEAALANHERRVAESGAAPLADPAERDRIANERITTYVDALVKAGKAREAADGEIRLKFGAAIAYVVKLMRGNARAAKVTIVPLAQPTAPSSAPAAPTARPGDDPAIEADLHAYYTRRSTIASASGKGKWRLGAISAVAFVALGAFLWDPLFAVILLGVIAFHEGGHYLVMKVVGYRNLNVFFVPGLGGLATGEKQDATAWQKVFVYLAGPVPGIAIATAGFIGVPAETMAEYPWLNTLFMTMLVINVINLLPVTPLDGGRVMEVLLFMRWPRIRVAFAVVSAFLLVAVGALTGERVMLVIGILVALALPAQLRFSKLARVIKRNPAERMDEPTAARRVFTALAMPAFAKWTFQHRAFAADELIAELRTPMPGILAIGAGLALYGACFVTPLAVSVVAQPGFRETAAVLWEAREELAEIAAEAKADEARRGPARDWATELAQARGGPPERHLALLVESGEEGFLPYEGGETALKARAAEMKRLADALPAGNLTRVNAKFALLRADEEDAERSRREAELRTLMGELDGSAPEAAALRGRIGLSLAYTQPSGPEKVQLLEQSRDALRAKYPPGHAYVTEAWAAYARERAEQGDAAGAEGEWKAFIASFDGLAQEDRLAKANLESARMGYAGFLVKQARFTDADALLRPAGEAALLELDGKKRPRLGRQAWQFQALFWIAVNNGDAASAQRWLSGWERSMGAAYAKTSPQVAVARLASADLAHDDAATQRAREQLTALPTAQSICAYPAPMFEGTAIATRQANLVARYGVCKGRAG